MKSKRKKKLHVASVQWQMCACDSFEAFADNVRELLDAADDAEVILFPEYFTLSLLPAHPGWKTGIDNYAILADFTDDYRSLFAEESTLRQKIIAAGTHLIRKDRSTLCNVAHLFTPGGGLYLHAKTHTFWRESQWGVAEAEELNIIELSDANIAMMICYESEMPEIATIQTRLGAEVILCPAYTFSREGFWRVRHCCQARCIENQVYIVTAFLVGQPPNGLSIEPGYGRSAILTPCDSQFPEGGIAIEAPFNEKSVIDYVLDLELLRNNRVTGAATTLISRDKHKDLYARYLN